MAITKEVKQDKIEIVTDFKHIQVREQTVSTEQVASSQSFSEATQLGSQTAISTQQDSSSNDGASAAIPDSAVNSEETLASGSVAIE